MTSDHLCKVSDKVKPPQPTSFRGMVNTKGDFTTCRHLLYAESNCQSDSITAHLQELEHPISPTVHRNKVVLNVLNAFSTVVIWLDIHNVGRVHIKHQVLRFFEGVLWPLNARC
jgi:hypothetical protein